MCPTTTPGYKSLETSNRKLLIRRSFLLALLQNLLSDLKPEVLIDTTENLSARLTQLQKHKLEVASDP